MTLIEVLTAKHKKKFLNFPKQLYKGDKNWICPLDLEIEGIFNPENNDSFKKGEAIRWLLCDGEKIIGRIAAFYDTHKAKQHKYLTGGCGFFECVNNQEAANVLFNAAKSWLESKGMQAMLGPVNFGENYFHWGLLVDGFMQQGYGMQYNFPYYKELFENFGFKNYFEQYSFHKPLAEGWPDRLLKFAELTAKRPGYSFERFSYKRIDEFVKHFVDVLNQIWAGYQENYTPLTNAEIKKMLLESKPIIDEDLIILAFDKGKPVGIILSIPDANQVLIKLKNGKLNLINKVRFVLNKSKISRNRALLTGIHPEYTNTGIVLPLFYQLVLALEEKPRQKEIELSWVGDYNPKMIGIYDKIGAKKMKTHITYLHQFDQKLPFERFNNEFEGKKY